MLGTISFGFSGQVQNKTYVRQRLTARRERFIWDRDRDIVVVYWVEGKQLVGVNVTNGRKEPESISHVFEIPGAMITLDEYYRFLAFARNQTATGAGGLPESRDSCG